ncbi:MAG: hypothetical protein HWE27_03295 [Gammaproteobacteria bacterium]|nr:hypothetical protein [Gammaproteobacteria bacterium]
MSYRKYCNTKRSGKLVSKFFNTAPVFFVLLFSFSLNSADAKQLYVKKGGQWKPVACDGKKPVVKEGKRSWKRKTRKLQYGNKFLNCPEKGNKTGDICRCSSKGENFHGGDYGGKGPLKDSVDRKNGGPIFPNSGQETCLTVKNNRIQVADSRKTDRKCNDFKLD